MFQITKSTSHSLNITGLNHTLSILTNKAQQKLFYVVPHTVFWKVTTVPLVPSVAAGGILPATVQIWVLEIDFQERFRKNMSEVSNQRNMKLLKHVGVVSYFFH
jgi:hypothetical protein